MGKRRLEVLQGGRSKKPGGTLPLFDVSEIDDHTLEKRVEDGTQEPVFNLLEGYGFSQQNLAPFKEKKVLANGTKVNNRGDGIGLEQMFEGMNNFESPDYRYGASHNILIRMNTPEIAALYLGIQQAKVNPKYTGLISLAVEDFPGLVSKIVEIGYQYDGVRKMADGEKGFNGHSKKPGELIQRMQYVPTQDRQKFIRSLQIAHRNFGRFTKELTYEFIWPFNPGEDSHDDTGKVMWIRRVVQFMGKLYGNNTASYLVVVNEKADNTIGQAVQQIFENRGGSTPLSDFKSLLVKRLETDPSTILSKAFSPTIQVGKMDVVGDTYNSNVYRVIGNNVYRNPSF